MAGREVCTEIANKECMWVQATYACPCMAVAKLPSFMYDTILHFFTMSVAACVCKRVTELNFFALVDGSSSLLFSSSFLVLGLQFDEDDKGRFDS